MSQVTVILENIDKDNPHAAEELLPLIYGELRKLAASRMANEKPGQTLQATALVHEAWLRLLGPEGENTSWENRGHFFSAAAEAMRRILLECARKKASEKHGGKLNRIELDNIDLAVDSDDETLLRVNEALEALANEEPECAELIKLRFFAGLEMGEIANMLNLSERSAYRTWAYGRAWLYDKLSAET